MGGERVWIDEIMNQPGQRGSCCWSSWRWFESEVAEFMGEVKDWSRKQGSGQVQVQNGRWLRRLLSWQRTKMSWGVLGP